VFSEEPAARVEMLNRRYQLEKVLGSCYTEDNWSEGKIFVLMDYAHENTGRKESGDHAKERVR
jgi:hypothetical protein